MRLPQFPIVDAIDAIPEAVLDAALRPVGAQMARIHLTHRLREPCLHVHAVGDVTDRHVVLAHPRVQRRPHRARNVTVQRRDRIGATAALEGEHRHAELFVAIAGVHASQPHERVPRHAERVAKRAEMFLDQVRMKAIVACRHRRVCREHDLRGNPTGRFGRLDALELHPAPNQFERRKGTVAFVEMDDSRRDAERRQRPGATDPEQQLLPDPRARVAAIEAGRQLAILDAVPVHVRIEQQQRIAADGHLPDAGDDVTGAGVDLDDQRLAVAERRLDRQHLAVDVEIVLVLPAFVIEMLAEIALVVIETDADQRDAEVGRALEVITGQDAEAAGIDRQRLVESELRREVRDRTRAEHAGLACAPRVFRLQVFLHPTVGVVDPSVQRQLGGSRLELRDRHVTQHDQRVVVALGPQHRIEIPEQAGGFVVPRPPQIVCQ